MRYIWEKSLISINMYVCEYVMCNMYYLMMIIIIIMINILQQGNAI